MRDQDKTKEQLIKELAEMRQCVAELETVEASHQQTKKALRERNRELALLDRVGREFTAMLDLQQVTEQLLPAATEIIGAEGASVWLWEGAPTGWLVCRTAYQRGGKPSLVNLRLRPGQGIAGWVAQEGKSAVVSNVQADPRFFSGIDEKTGFRTFALLAIPLWARDRVIGVLEVVNKLEGDFGKDDQTLAETLAASAAIAIENARLVETLRQRTTDLQASYQKLDVFDDLRGPLGLIVSFAETLEENHVTLPREELHRYLHTIAQKGREAVEVIDQLLLARAEPPAEIEEAIGALDMANVVAGVLERLAYAVEEYQAEIILPDSWPVALGHTPWVEEVWTNYINNAIKYGGQPPRVELGATEQKDGTLRFWVRDNGPGLATEEQVQLFTPFTRIDQIRDPEYGLGLILAQRVVEKLGGRIGVESEVGQGSLFFFTLPSAS